MTKTSSKNLFFTILLFIIVFYGLILRIYQIDVQSYWIDEAFSINAAQAIIENYYPQLESGYVYSRALSHHYLTAISISLFGFNEFATRIIAVIMGTLTIYLVYLLVKKIESKEAALIASFFTSFSYIQIAWSRQARMYSSLQFFFLLSIYMFISLFDKFSYKKLIILIISTIIAIDSHYLGLVLIPIYILSTLFFIYHNQESRLARDIIKYKYKIIFSIIVLTYIFKGALIYAYKQFINGLEFMHLPFLNYLRDSLGLILFMALFGLIITIISDYKDKQKLFYTLTLSSALILVISLVPMLSGLKMYRYYFYIMPIIFIFAAIFIDKISNKASINKYIAMIILISVPIYFNFNTNIFNFKPQGYYRLEARTPQPMFKEAYNTIEEDEDIDEKIIISPYPYLDKIYLNKSDYALAMNLHGGRLIEKEAYNIYTNTPNINSYQELADIIKNNNGYIIIDTMSIVDERLNIEIINLIQEQELILKDEYFTANTLWLYKF